MRSAAVVGWSVHVPGLDAAARLGLEPAGPACSADDARLLLGRKGLLFKEPATRLALCAAHTAIGWEPGRRREPGPPDPRTAVVASSNLGNVATIVDLVRTVRAEGGGAVSPLAAPNASSNIIASAVASWFGWGGPNLMLCSGATSGLDAVSLALLLLASGRADRVVVVGSEPADDTATALHRRRRGAAKPLREAAACVVLAPDTPVAGTIVGPVRVADRTAVDGTAALPGFDDVLAGDGYGADGVIRLAAAAAVLSTGQHPGPVRVVSGDGVDGWRQVDVSRGGTG